MAVWRRRHAALWLCLPAAAPAAAGGDCTASGQRLPGRPYPHCLCAGGVSAQDLPAPPPYLWRNSVTFFSTNMPTSAGATTWCCWLDFLPYHSTGLIRWSGWRFTWPSTTWNSPVTNRVLKRMDQRLRPEYSASLLNLAAGRHIFPVHPLAFGEGNVKERIKNVMNYKTPTLAGLTIGLAICVAATVCLASNPVSGPPNDAETALSATPAAPS